MGFYDNSGKYHAFRKHIPLPILGWREVDADGDVGAIAANGGILASDTTPIQRANAEGAQEISWATGNTDKIGIQAPLPPDFQPNDDLWLELWVSSGTTDAADFAVETGFDGDTLIDDAADDSTTKSATVHKVTVVISKADLPAAGASYVNVLLKPPAHATDTIQLHNSQLSYVPATTSVD